MERVLVFGGSFDPVHNAHLALANEVLLKMQSQLCLWVPCKQRVFDKQQQASAEQRLEMLRLALSPSALTHRICDIEVRRHSPSYTYLTLEEIRAGYPDNTWLGFIMGSDNFLEFKRWHAYDKFHNLCNIIVYQRNQTDEIDVQNMAQESGYHFTKDLAVFLSQNAGNVYYMQGNYPSASTRIREAIAHHQKNIPELDPLVQKYIEQKGLYQKVML